MDVGPSIATVYEQAEESGGEVKVRQLLVAKCVGVVQVMYRCIYVFVILFIVPTFLLCQKEWSMYSVNANTEYFLLSMYMYLYLHVL